MQLRVAGELGWGVVGVGAKQEIGLDLLISSLKYAVPLFFVLCRIKIKLPILCTINMVSQTRQVLAYKLCSVV
jgi:hypothetical protein